MSFSNGMIIKCVVKEQRIELMFLSLIRIAQLMNFDNILLVSTLQPNRLYINLCMRLSLSVCLSDFVAVYGTNGPDGSTLRLDTWSHES